MMAEMVLWGLCLLLLQCFLQKRSYIYKEKVLGYVYRGQAGFSFLYLS